MKKKWKILLLSGAFALPLNQSESWQLLKFSKLPPNKTEFTSEGMLVKVQRSSSPIIYPFSKPLLVNKIYVKGKLSGRLQLNGVKQGQKGADDYELKLGLVLAGKKTLNWGQQLIAAEWVKKLYSLAPKGTGIDKILFLNAVQDKKLLNQSRTHPLSDLLFEQNVWYIEKEGDFELQHLFAKEEKVLAIWLSIDGDDTQSQYEVTLKQIDLEISDSDSN